MSLSTPKSTISAAVVDAVDVAVVGIDTAVVVVVVAVVGIFVTVVGPRLVYRRLTTRVRF